MTAWVSASVTGSAGFTAPSGPITLTYYAGATATGTPLLASPIAPGSYTVVAAYAGDGNYTPAMTISDVFHQPHRRNLHGLYLPMGSH